LIPKPELLPIGVEIQIPAPPTADLFREISTVPVQSRSKQKPKKQTPIRQPVPPAPMIPKDD